MKTIKPDKLGLLHRTFEHDGRPYFVVSVLVGFSFDAPRALMSEVDLWKMAAEELEADKGLLDEGSSKQQGEVLVTGKCFAAGGAPVAVSFVRVQMGSVDKRLAVLGDRQWRYGVPTPPEPFTEMPVGWTHAFGGEGYAQNPLGKGVAEIETEAGKVHPLPNVESPKRLVVSPGDKPPPAGLGAIDLTWPQRFSLIGTYDAKWLKTRFPGYAADMDPSFFNVASKDQRIEGYWKGDEAFVVENMHPGKPRLSGSLPGASVRVFVTHRGEDGAETLREIVTRVDTVRLFPHREVGVLVYRGMMAVREDDAADIVHLVVGCEDPASPKTVEHYRTVLAQRLDPEKGAVHSLREEDLMPPRAAGWAPRPEKSDVSRMVEKEDRLAKNMRRRQEKEFAKNRAKVVAAGLDPKDFGLDALPPEEPAPDPDDADAVMARLDKEQKEAEQQRKEMETKKVELEAHVRDVYAAQGQSYDDLVKAGNKEAAGPPKYRAAEQLAWLRSMLKVAREGKAPLTDLEAKAEDPAFEAQLVEQEKALVELYRTGAHMRDPAGPRGEGSEAIRTELELAKHNDIALSGRDFTGADLSRLVLPGIDLSGAFLESVDLTGADLRGANLEGAVLAHATLRGTNLSGARLKGANLGAANLDGADLSRCAMEETVLARAKIKSTTFRGATMRQVNLLEAVFGEGVDFTEVVAEQAILLRVDLTKAIFAGADFTKAVFLESKLTGADLSGATLTKATFVTVNADGAVFRGGKLDGAQFVHGCSLEGADFSDASMQKALLRGTKLARARLAGALLDAADLSECDATDADMTRIVARGALFIRSDLTRAAMSSADLLGAILQKAKLLGTDLRRSNLFRADLARVRTDPATRMQDANMKHARMNPRAVDDGSSAPKPPLKAADGSR